MATARGMFDAAKHPRGLHGQFGSSGRSYSVRNVGRKGLSRSDRERVAKAGKQVLPTHSYAHNTTNVYSTVPRIQKSVVKFTPALYSTSSGYREGIGRFKMSAKTGRFEPAGWRPKRTR